MTVEQAVKAVQVINSGEPSSSAHTNHQNRQEKQCDYALACLSYYGHIRDSRPGDWPGWKRFNFNGHDCDSTEYEPSQATTAYHQRRGEPACAYARACSSYYNHNREGRRGGWTGLATYHTGHDCDSTDYEPSGVAYSYHRRRGETQCDYARVCSSYYRHVTSGLPENVWDNNSRLPDNIPTSLYRIKFNDSATYYGITSCKDEYRVAMGYASNGTLDWKLSNEDHVRDTLVICPSRSYAFYVEASLISAHNEREEGILLNIQRPTPVLPMMSQRR